MTETTDAIVIGAGVIGLAVARELAMHGRQVIVIERNAAIGQETSSRNSEVIHAGIYYATDSLKARLCVAGKERLYDYCREKDIPHQRCGKVIVAVNEAQEPALAALREQASANGVNDLEWLDAAELAGARTGGAEARRASGRHRAASSTAMRSCSRSRAISNITAAAVALAVGGP